MLRGNEKWLPHYINPPPVTNEIACAPRKPMEYNTEAANRWKDEQTLSDRLRC